MNIALITAGGVGARVGSDIPKQFLCVVGKPVIIHTLEKFERHSEIDLIAVVCVKGWEEKLYQLANDFHISKLKHIIPAGSTNQESIFFGVEELSHIYGEEDVILVHDAVRPLVSEAVISDCLNVTRKKGNAVACLPCVEPLLCKETQKKEGASKWHSRTGLMRAQAPQGFYLGKLAMAHRIARERGIKNCVASCELMLQLGEKIYFSRSEMTNIKITTQEDITLVETLLTNSTKSALLHPSLRKD